MSDINVTQTHEHRDEKNVNKAAESSSQRTKHSFFQKIGTKNILLYFTGQG